MSESGSVTERGRVSSEELAGYQSPGEALIASAKAHADQEKLPLLAPVRLAFASMLWPWSHHGTTGLPSGNSSLLNHLFRHLSFRRFAKMEL